MAAHRPTVSVIVPVHNRRSLLRDLIRGLGEQTLIDFELIVVDDGSTDGSGDEAKGAAVGAAPVVVLRTEGIGAVAARNLGVQAARGEIFAFTDSDCVPDPGWLAAGARAIEEGAAVVQGVTRPARHAAPLERSVDVGRETGIYETCNVFYRRAAFEAAGGFDEGAGVRLGFRRDRSAQLLGFGEDTLIGWRVRRSHSATFSPDAVVRHHVFPRHLPSSVSRAWMAGGFPALVREVPELRGMLLRRGFILGNPWRLPLYVGALAAVARRPRIAAAGVTAWTWGTVRSVPDPSPGTSRRDRAIAVGGTLALDLVTAASLAIGSARARTIVL